MGSSFQQQRSGLLLYDNRPLLDSFGVWLRERLLTLSTQSDTTKAINYMLNQWQALVYYCDNGIAEIDNNIAENALRGCCLVRRNFLFLGADSGGERAAAMYSLIGSARMNGLDPEAYLRHAIRLRHQETARAILAALRDRLADTESIELELLRAEPADGSDLV